MCHLCHKARRRAVVLALTPLMAFGQPAIQSLLSVTRTGDKPPSTVGWLGDGAIHAAEAKASTDSALPKYTCPMHPHYIANEMGTCPICGMNLVKLETDSKASETTAVDGRAAVTISPETIQNMGVRLGKAELSDFGRRIRSYGIVHEDERRRTEITARVEGWIDGLKVTAIGDMVKKGDLLFHLYSPKLIVSQNDYLTSRSRSGSPVDGVAQLRAFGVQKRALDQISKQKRPMQLIPFYAQQDGTVSELSLREGTYVKRGMVLARIQDYTTVWLMVGVAEKDLEFIRKGTPAIVTFPNQKGGRTKARVDYVYPTVDVKTRTGQVRLVIDNREGLIRPGSYADVFFEVGSQKRIAVPSESVLQSGQGNYVVVSLGQGRFESRLVQTGIVADGWTEVKSGIQTNEDVVVSGQFLLDSESALRESFRKLQKLQVPLSLLKLSQDELAMIDHLVDAALYVHEALSDGYDIDPKQLDAAISIKDRLLARYKDTQLAFVLEDAVPALKALQAAKTASETHASLSKLTESLLRWIIGGAPEHYKKRKLAVFREAGSGRHWLQLGGKALNPYGSQKAELIPYSKQTVAAPQGKKKQAKKAMATPPIGGHRGH